MFAATAVVLSVLLCVGLIRVLTSQPGVDDVLRAAELPVLPQGASHVQVDSKRNVGAFGLPGEQFLYAKFQANPAVIQRFLDQSNLQAVDRSGSTATDDPMMPAWFVPPGDSKLFRKHGVLTDLGPWTVDVWLEEGRDRLFVRAVEPD